MSKSIDANLSVAGDQAQQLSTRDKISLALVIVGVGVLLWALLDESSSWSIRKILGFVLILIGAGIFNFKKWYYNVGSVLFTAGLALVYVGYYFSKSTKYYLILGGFGLMLLASGFFTYDPNKKYALFGQYGRQLNWTQKFGLLTSLAGLGILIAAWAGVQLDNSKLFLTLSFALMTVGIGLYTYGSYAVHTAGIKNNFNQFNSATSRGILGWVIGIALTLFYVQLYWNSEPLAGIVSLFDPWSWFFRGKAADQWFLYGTLYTFVILALGIKFMIKYRNNRYQLIRTIVVIFSQLVLAYFIPTILEGLHYNGEEVVIAEKTKYLYYSGNPINSWPLNYGNFTESNLVAYTHEVHQPVGMAYLFWSILMFLVVTPVVTYFVGKRWYCSWFCGCGGLAETAGDSFRHLSNKTVKAWKIERWVMHSVMVFVLVMTIAAIYPYLSGSEYGFALKAINKNVFYFGVSALSIGSAVLLYFGYRKYKHKILIVGAIIFLFILIFLSFAYFAGGKDIFILESGSLKQVYGFFIGSAFSGVIGVGFYPILGNRVWCRFGCPMAGYMGLFQRFKSRFRITTNGAQCISCGNCSTYCEQGIDVRAYAQKGENIVRSSCVGCGICSSVCPRGVLKLENGPEEGRFEPNPLIVTKDGVKLNM